jgi:hypothetical protein
MHYIVGQDILNGTHTIHLIMMDEKSDSIKIWIEGENEEILLWKEFTSSMPVSIEYNINF